MKYDLKKMILNHIEINCDKEMKLKLAKIAGYANETGLMKFLKKEKKVVQDFKGLIDLIKYLFLDHEKEIMSDYIKTLNPNCQSARYSVEYAIQSGLYNLADEMIEKLKNSSNNESKEWGAVYEVDRLVSRGDISFYDSIQMINDIRPYYSEMRIYGKITQLYAYYECKLFDLFFELSKELEEDIKQIEDEFLKLSYMCRYGLIMLNVYMHLNDVETARKYGHMVLENSTKDSTRSIAYLQLGNSYIFENYDVAFNYMEKARLYAEKLDDNGRRLINAKRSINFLQNYWSKEPLFLDYESNHYSDRHEIAFYNIRKGDNKEALRFLNLVNKEELSEYGKGFHYFYRGLISNNKDDFLESVIAFKKSGDRFYRNLPLIELKKMGIDDKILIALGV